MTAFIATGFPSSTRALDADANGIDDTDELLLARRFCPAVQLHGPETALNGFGTPVYPVPVSIMGLSHPPPDSIPAGDGITSDHLFTLWRAEPLQYPYGDHWVRANGWTPPLPESLPTHNYAALVDDPADRRTSIAPPAMPSGVYNLRFHWEYGNPAIDEPHEWYAVWRAGNDWTLPGAAFPPTVYVHLFRCDVAGCDIAPPVPATEVVIQYWFFFPFNDWVNNHEGDWEGINVLLSSADPATATITEVEMFAHKFYVARDPTYYPALENHVLLVDDTHPVVFLGGHGRVEGCIGGTGEGEGSHGCYPTFGRWSEVGGGDPIGCFDSADEVIAHAAGPYIDWRDFDLHVIPNPHAPNRNYNVEPELAWLAANLRWGTRRVPSVGGALWSDVGNWAPPGPVYNTEERWNRTARGSLSEPYVTSGLARPRPYYPAATSGWAPFALFLDTFTGQTSWENGNLSTWTPGTGTWQIVAGTLVGSGDGSHATTNRASFIFDRPPLWYSLPFVDMNPRMTRFACDVSLVDAMPETTQVGVTVQAGTKYSEQVRVVWWRESGAWRLRTVWTSDDGNTWTVGADVPVQPLTSSPRRLEVVTLDRCEAPVAFHDVYLDGEPIIESAATLSVGDSSRNLVADGTAGARFDRIAVSYTRMGEDYRHPPFATWTDAPGAGDTVRVEPYTLAWLAADEKWDDGIAAQRIELSTDGGAGWETVAVMEGDVRTLEWLPPVPATTVIGTLRLVVTDVEDDTRTITSEPFTLTADVTAVRSDELDQPEHTIRLSIPNLPAVPAAGGAELEIRFSLPWAAAVRLRIIDIHGRMVRLLTDRAQLSEGTHGVRWDFRDETGAPVPTGVYFCRLDAGHRRAVRKIQVIR